MCILYSFYIYLQVCLKYMKKNIQINVQNPVQKKMMDYRGNIQILKMQHMYGVSFVWLYYYPL